MRTIKQIIRKADVSRRHFEYLRSGGRNATAATAKRIERATGLPKEIWVFGTSRQRRDAVKAYLCGGEKIWLEKNWRGK